MADTADYIATVSRELNKLALTCELHLLAYVLDMAREEAVTIAASRNEARSLDGGGR